MFDLIDKSKGYLFSTYDLNQILRNQVAEMRREVDALEANRLLNTAPDDLAHYLIEKYSTEPITLRREEWHATEHETQIDVSQDPHRPPCQNDLHHLPLTI